MKTKIQARHKLVPRDIATIAYCNKPIFTIPAFSGIRLSSTQAQLLQLIEIKTYLV